jgi:CRISPR-associated protein Csx10
VQLKLKFTLTFESDWHISAGFGSDGKVDAVIDRDPQGRPVISGTTLKGVFRDALYDLARNLGKNDEEAKKLTHLLGAPGHDSRWYFSAASPQANGLRESLVATGVRVDPRYRRAEDNKYFVRELGAAEIFTFTVTGTINDDEALENVEWLAAAGTYVQRLGGRQRRGNGLCHISLDGEALNRDVLNSFAVRQCGEVHKVSTEDILKRLQVRTEVPQIASHSNLSHRYRVILYTQRPVVIAEKPEAGNVYQGQITIPGQTLRGAFAELASPNELGKSDYAQFKRLFVLGGLKFSHLNPLEIDGDVGIPTAQSPLGLQQVEGTPECCFTSVFQQITEQKAFSGWIRLQDSLQKASFRTESHPHVRIDSRLKRASDGDLYAYEAVPAGRYYTGELYLEDEDWLIIGKLLGINLNETFEVRIGKGRSRSYGQCQVVIIPMDDDPPVWIHVPLEHRLKATPLNELYITLTTATILQDTWGRFYGCFNGGWIDPLLEQQPSNVQITPADTERPGWVVRTKLVESFDARSGLPRWRDKALIAGSTARLVFIDGNRPSIDVLKRLEAQGIGLRRGEGYGRVVFNHPAHTGQWSGFAKAIDISVVYPASSTGSAGETAEDFTRRWKEKVRSRVHERGLNSDDFKKIRQSLARQIMQRCSIPVDMQSDKDAHHEAIDEIVEQITPKTTQAAKKDSYENYKKAVDVVRGLLEQAKGEGERWRKAVVILAELLMNYQEKA